MQRREVTARKDAPVPPEPKRRRRRGEKVGHPAHGRRAGGVSLLCLSVPARVLIGFTAAAIVWLAIGWALA